jgi:hypothetical protein
MGGCGTTGKLNVVSPSLSEDEIKGSVRGLPTIKLQSPKKEEVVSSEKVITKETVHPEESSISTDKTQEALINLLEKKGVITKKELLEEIRKLNQMTK